jgi:hypothetical protein
MRDIVIHKAEDLAPTTKVAVEVELGRPVRKGEEISIMALFPHEAPVGEEKEQAVAGLRKCLDRIDERTKQVPEEEMEQLVKDALRYARPGYRERE